MKFALLLYRIAMLSFARRRRDGFGHEMVACFRAAYEDRRSRGGARAAVAYTVRACIDAVIAGLRDRAWMRQSSRAQMMGRRMNGAFISDLLVRDARYAMRSLRQRWRFSLGVMVTLALGLGLGVPVLSLADYYFLRTPPGVHDANRILRLIARTSGRNGVSYTDGLTGLDYGVFSTRSHALSGVAAWMNLPQSLGVGADARTVSTTLTSASYPSVLGVRLALGRWFTDAEDMEGANEAPCVVSYDFWKTTLGGSSSAIGRTFMIGGVHYDVVGVAPAGFSGLTFNPVDIWLPIHVAAPAFQGHDPMLWTTDHSSWLRIVARVKPGVSVDVAATEAALLYRTSGTRTRDPELKQTMLWDPIAPGRSRRGDKNAKIALWLAGGGALLLLLVLANLVNLSLSRAVADTRQTAVRLAIGGNWNDLFRPRIVESAILSALAATTGLLIAYPTVRVVRTLMLPNETWLRPALDLRSAALAFGIALSVGGILAVWTTLHMTRVNPATLLRGTAGGGGSAQRSHTVRRVLLVAQAAIFAVLLTGATAFVTSLHRAASTNFGFAPDSVMVGRIAFDSDVPAETERGVYNEALERIRALPGVQAVALGYMEPQANNTTQALYIPGATIDRADADFDIATPDYLRTFGMAMRSGRWISADDRATTAPIIVINDAFAHAQWPAGDAIGKCIGVGDESQPCRTIVGIVNSIFVSGRVDDPRFPIYYIPVAQASAYAQTPRLFYRPRGSDASTTFQVRRILQQLRPDLPAVDTHSVGRNFTWLAAPLRLGAAAFTAFGVLAAIIASIGLHSMAAFLVAEQRRSSAIKLAIGAQISTVTRPVFLQSIVTVAGGLAVGFLLLVPLARVLEPMLFHTRLLEPMTVAAVASLGVAVSLLAAASPVRTMRRTDVMSVLREE